MNKKFSCLVKVSSRKVLKNPPKTNPIPVNKLNLNRFGLTIFVSMTLTPFLSFILPRTVLELH